MQCKFVMLQLQYLTVHAEVNGNVNLHGITNRKCTEHGHNTEMSKNEECFARFLILTFISQRRYVGLTFFDAPLTTFQGKITVPQIVNSVMLSTVM